eukprot:s1_g2173.t1
MSGLTISRRQAIAGLGLVSLAGLADLPAFGRTRARVVIVGGGFGGATAARLLARLLPSSEIILIDTNPAYMACPFSNLVIGTDRPMEMQAFSYDGLVRESVVYAKDSAIDVDPTARMVTLQSGSSLPYDRLILSPGIDIRYGAIEGYDEAATEAMPHAWKAGRQTLRLRDQLQVMPEDGLAVMSVPAAPYRCPPGPYERASLIAHYLKTLKPRAKLLILDAKDSFSKMPLFLEAWKRLYPDHLEWRSASDDGRVNRVDGETGRLFTDFEEIQADVANVIPPQKAGWIAERAGVTDGTGWCPIDAVGFESTLQPNIHVIGDATIAAPMPKSAFSANLQGKICAIAVARALSDLAPEPTVLANTCYSYVAPDQAVSITGVYSNEDGGGLVSHGHTGSVRLMRLSLLVLAVAVLIAGCDQESDALVQASDIVGDSLPGPLTAAKADPDRGAHVFADRDSGHCVLCHQVDGLDAPFQGNVGPALSDIGDRLSPGQIRLRIVDYQLVKPGAVMPSYYRIHDLNRVSSDYEGKPALGAQDVEDLVAYLATLKGSLE